METILCEIDQETGHSLRSFSIGKVDTKYENFWCSAIYALEKHSVIVHFNRQFEVALQKQSVDFETIFDSQLDFLSQEIKDLAIPYYRNTLLYVFQKDDDGSKL